MAAIFQSLRGSAIPSRLLRYAISKLDLLEIDASDLLNSGLAIGRNTVIELRNVGVKLPKLERVLKLPPTFTLLKARVLVLRITVPLDFYSSAVTVEVDGVEVKLKIQSPEDAASQPKSPSRPASASGELPTTVDLAQSFLEQESPAEKRELEAALAAETQDLGASLALSEDESDDESVYGTGEGLSLPAFLGDFLQGIMDRTQIQIRGVTFQLDVGIPVEPTAPTPDLVTFELAVGNVNIEGVTTNPQGPEGPAAKIVPKEGKRHIALENIAASLISEANVFSTFACSPSAPASACPQSPAAAFRSPLSGRSSSSASASSQRRNEDDEAMSRSMQLDQGPYELQDSEDAFNIPYELESSSEGADDDPEPAASPMSTPRASMYHDFTTHPHIPSSHSAIVQTEHSAWAPTMREAQSVPGISFEQGDIHHGDLDPLSYHDPTSLASSSSASSGSGPAAVEDLAQSHLFTHEEAESMYMSAFSQAESVQMRTKMPGAWDSGDSSPDSSPKATRRLSSTAESVPIIPEVHRKSSADLSSATSSESAVLEPAVPDSPSSTQGHLPSSEVQHTETLEEEPTSSENPESNADSEEPEPAAPEECATPRGPTRMVKRVLSLDCISIYAPPTRKHIRVVNPDVHSGVSGTTPAFPIPGSSRTTSLHPPGAFSMHASLSSSPPPPDTPSSPKEHADFAKGPPTGDSLEVTLSPLNIQFDASIGFILAMVVSRLLAALKGMETGGSAKEPAASAPAGKASPFKDIKLTMEEVSLLFLEQLAGVADTSERIFSAGPGNFNRDILLQTHLRNVVASISPSTTAVEVEGFTFGYGGEDATIIAFDRTAQMTGSIRDAIPAHGAEVSIKIQKTEAGTNCEILTLPLLAQLDLRRLDETFSWFGGLSSFLSMGSSMTSNAAAVAIPAARAPVKGAEKPRGVRFDAPINPDDRSASSENKLNMRVGSIRLDLVGKDCSVVLETSALKLVNRDEGLGVHLSKMRLHGPYSASTGHNPPINIVVVGTRLEYSPTPKDKELERLLELISPSKLKFDGNEDEIMVETLLRQRRKGPVLRISLEKAEVDVSNIPLLNCLPSLGEDLARLGTVAKYLPEDDRPGLLTLALMRDLAVSVDAGGRFGVIATSMKNFDVAHITVPSLIALGVGEVCVTRNKIEELVGSSLLPLSARSQAPVLMLRMIGDVIEPHITVKLRGLNFEYRVPTIIDLLDLAADATPEDFEAGLAASVANLGGQAQMAMGGKRPGHDSTLGAKDSNKTPNPKVELSLLDCVLGLNPLAMTSKMGIVFIDTHLEVILADGGNLQVRALAKKAAVLLMDDVASVDWEDQQIFVAKHMHRPSDQHTRAREWDMASALCARGFVNICHIQSANATIRVATDSDGDKIVDVEVKDNLVVLETCADSTQTMIAIANGLTPPTPPSKEVKFKTEIVPMEDLLASIAPDAFTRAEGAYNFDDDFGGQGYNDDDVFDDESLSFSGALEPDFFPSQGPGQEEEEVGEALFDAMSSSMLSDRTHTQQDGRDGVLVGNPSAGGSGGLVVQEDFFGSKPKVQKKSKQWNSARMAFERSTGKKVVKSPLTATLRNVHVIWHLFDGYDWQRTRDTIAKTVQEVEAKAYERRARSDRRSGYDEDFDAEEDVIGDFLFNSIYIGIPANHDPKELAQAITQDLYGGRNSDTESMSAATTTVTATTSRAGGLRATASKKRLRLGRSRRHKITFELQGVNVDVATFPRGSGETESAVEVRVRDLEIFDHVPTSTWKKFATYDKDAGEREVGSSMVHVELLNVRPVADAAATEIVLKATVLPLRLHVDQDALDFITRFFEFKDDSVQAPPRSKSDIPFIQRAEVNSIPVRLDFKPKRVDYAGLRSGHTTEFMNFLILEGSSMVLRHCIIYGTSGFEKLGLTLNDIWMPDVKRNQLPGVLAGLAPVRSLVDVGSGFRTLIEVPYREYKRDGRIVRSLGKGAAAFAKTTGTELVKLGAKVAVGTQYVLQGAEGMLTKNPSSHGSGDHYHETTSAEHHQQQYGGVGAGGGGSPSGAAGWEEMDDDADDDAADGGPAGEEGRKKISLYANQPTGVVQGLRHAYASLSRDLSVARDAIVAVPAEVMESGSATGAAAAVMRRAPTIIFRPAIGATKAIGQTLLGATNTIDPQNLRRVEDKYKSGPRRQL